MLTQLTTTSEQPVLQTEHPKSILKEILSHNFNFESISSEVTKIVRTINSNPSEQIGTAIILRRLLELDRQALRLALNQSKTIAIQPLFDAYNLSVLRFKKNQHSIEKIHENASILGDARLFVLSVDKICRKLEGKEIERIVHDRNLISELSFVTVESWLKTLPLRTNLMVNLRKLEMIKT